ncbi:bifunctional Ribosomal protein L12-P1-P2 family/Ribosomal protein P1-P2 [Babesia duncani]|uniref:Bifunctional Ribosomal protein L12-P1-P2 family/Ribosomal protein P1-P2 n=1 Tax=Babesia duncani TaxID=323732 RepID=A0AAD9PL36_9APIC|nr:bifunctional Ribosomal protein L12-P1-P2 family/Ribosomal protein P1-P2 [Babesia duncani]KAK2196442.1 bifunctional Ribosomal protein L12-P1-P2 family/Ribosomal protein P1-P2 [Babesia duncani]
MATVPFTELPQGQLEELMCVYSSLILHDEGLDISQENIMKLIKAAKGKIQPFMPMIFDKSLKGRDIGALFSGVGAGAAPVAAAGAGAAAPAAAETKAPEPEAEEEDDDMGFSLFD